MPSYSNSHAIQSGLEAQANFMSEITSKTYDSVRSLSELNMHFMRQVMQDFAEASRQLASCRDPLQLVTTAANAAQPVVQHLRSYQQQLVGLLTGTQVTLTRGAEALMPDSMRYASAMAQTMVRESASTGSDTVASAVHPQSAGDSGAAGSGPHAPRVTH